MEDFSIKVSGLGKKYTIGTAKEGQLRYSLSNFFKKRPKKGEDFWALRNIDFEVKQGEVIGIIGKNGAGKSTLLKLLSQITKPTEGKIQLNGRVASLLEVGTGFHPELTGRENIFLNGTILGMTRKEVKDKFDEIVAFSGIEKFIDTPVKRYSSGMYVRLAFSVAAHLEPEILIIDEVLAVGDAEFQAKCIGKMQQVSGEGRTVLFVSHNLTAVRSLCQKGILISNGEIVAQGDMDQVLSEYSKNSTTINISSNQSDKTIKIEELLVFASGKDTFDPIDEYDEVIIQIKMAVHSLENSMKVTYVLTNGDGIDLFAFSDDAYEISQDSYKITCVIPKGFLNIGDYFLTLYLIDNKSVTILKEDNIGVFTVVAGKREIGAWMGKEPGFIKPQFEWKIEQI